MRKIYTGVDIGSDAIKIVVLELYQNKLNLLAASSVKSSGIKKGLITDAQMAEASLKKAINEVEEMLGMDIKKVVALIPMYNAEYIYSKGSINIENEENKVINADINKVFHEVINGRIRPGYELVTIQPIDFAVDDRIELKDPKGLSGSVLSCRGIVITTPRKNIYSVVSLLESIGIEVVDVSISGIGDVFVTRTSENIEQVGAVINVGAQITTVSVVNKGVIAKATVIPLGSHNIDSDISYIFKVPLQTANKLKEKFACAHRRFATPEEIKEVENVNKDMIKVNQYELSEVVMFRAKEILELAKKELNTLTNKKMQYIILTGGSSHLAYFQDLAEEVLNQKVIISDIKVIGARNNKYSAVIGNVVYFISKLNVKGMQYSMFNNREQEEIGVFKTNDILGNTTLNQIFGFFTNE